MCGPKHMFNMCVHCSWVGKGKLKIMLFYLYNQYDQKNERQAMLNVLISLFAGVGKKRLAIILFHIKTVDTF